MPGPYCRYCDHRCFVARTLPDFSWSGHLATCPDGMAHDRKRLGFDHSTALNLDPRGAVPPGLQLQQVGDSDTWRVIHTASGKHIPLIDWRPPGVPYRYALVAAASLAISGVAWTSPPNVLVDDLTRVAAAARVASTTAYDAAVHRGDWVDDRPPPHDLASRRAKRHGHGAPAQARTNEPPTSVPTTGTGAGKLEVGSVAAAIVVTHDRRRGLAAIHAMACADLGRPASLCGVDEIWARFSPRAEEGDEIGEWVMQPCQEGDEGAMRAVFAAEVGEVSGASEPATAARQEVAGKHLVCWCPPGQPCHADVLLEIENGGGRG